MEWLLDPLSASFVQRAVLGGALVAIVCGVVGTWVVVRGMAFLGDAMSHGLLPGIAIASLLGGNLIVGAVVLAAAAVFHRAFTGAAFNQQKAATLGLRPRLAHFVLLCLITLAVASSFQVVGTLLVFGLLIAPPAAALVWAKSIRTVMVLGSLIGVTSVVFGLWISWYASTAAGATIALTAALSYFVSALARATVRQDPKVRKDPTVLETTVRQVDPAADSSHPL